MRHLCYCSPAIFLVLWIYFRTMAELKRHISSRRGNRAHLTKLLQTLHETLSDMHSPLSEDQIATLKDLHDQLERKQELISGLDAKILEGITDNTEIEAEILQTEEINSSISNAKAKIVQRLKPTTPAVVAPPRTTSPLCQSTNTSSGFLS